jgi:NAD(P)-dependent dehydrogenase (short-subunit alcohol dehydrogenase family)
VAVLDRDEAGGAETVALVADAGGRASFVACDVGSAEAIRSAVDRAATDLGGIDVLVSNAASYARGSVTDLTLDDWDRTLAVCLTATYRLAHDVVPAMRAAGGVSIVVVSSVHGIRGYGGHAAYQAAKAGLLGLTRSMAADLAPHIRVNAVLPGAVVTGLWKDVGPEERERSAQACPLLRNGDPDDVAGPIAFLASDLAAYITGETLVVDGGMMVKPSPMLAGIFDGDARG